MRSEDSINTDDPEIPRAVSGGVTTVQVLPGSGNNIGGWATIVKLNGGQTLDEIKLAGAPLSMKWAWGENPKRVYGGKGQAPSTLMGEAAMVRQKLYDAQNYTAKWKAWEDGTAQEVCAVIGLPTATADAQRAAQAPIGILAYHRFDPTTPGPTTVTNGAFERQLEWLVEHHYKFVPLRAVVDGLTGKAPPVVEPAVAITADDGHRSVYTEMFPIIKKRHIPVTLFIYPSAISNASYALTWDQLKEMHNSGLVDVESHTYWHPDFRKERARQSPEEYRAFVDNQLTRSKSVLEDKLGITVDMLAWPYGIVDPELEAAAKRAGYVVAFGFGGGATMPRGDDLFALPRVPMSDAVQGASLDALLQPEIFRKGGAVTHAFAIGLCAIAPRSHIRAAGARLNGTVRDGASGAAIENATIVIGAPRERRRIVTVISRSTAPVTRSLPARRAIALAHSQTGDGLAPPPS